MVGPRHIITFPHRCPTHIPSHPLPLAHPFSTLSVGRHFLCITMTTRQQTCQPSKGVSADRLMALPSLSCSLSSLPQAKTMDSVSLHQSMYAQRAAEGEAKARCMPPFGPITANFFHQQLQKVLSKTAASYSPQTPPSKPVYMNPVRINLGAGVLYPDHPTFTPARSHHGIQIRLVLHHRR